ncbi:transglycosylase SLT domain-containing protein [Streptomyces sp. 184]|uniref:transglycosylase SLT domain-containing protein n=1 Tax=Streptomyces sp. 184 TaxID=1827526 RepID=UPI003891667F
MSAPALQRPALPARRRLLAAGGWAAAAVALTVAVAPQAAAEPRSASPAAPVAAPATVGTTLDEWINEALVVMELNGIPGTYEGIHRNILRESGGDPAAINNWDSNAAAGIPSQGLLQVIPPTFAAYHVAGTSTIITDPVANIVAACNYAADRYGSIDNVFGAY